MNASAIVLGVLSMTLSVPGTSLPEPVAPITATAIVEPPSPPASSFAWPTRGPRLGVQVTVMSAELREFFGAPGDAGLLIQGVDSGSAAGRAGLEVGDVLVEVAGRRIDDVGDVRSRLGELRVGDAFEVVVVRQRKRKVLEVTAAPARQSADADRTLEPEVRALAQREIEAARRQLRALERRLEPETRERVRASLRAAHARLRGAERELSERRSDDAAAGERARRPDDERSRAPRARRREGERSPGERARPRSGRERRPGEREPARASRR